jgi:hypothetical protein
VLLSTTETVSNLATVKPGSAFERSHPAADASRGMNGAVVACWLR